MASADSKDIGTVVADHPQDKRSSIDEKTDGPVDHVDHVHLTDEQAAHRLKMFRENALHDPNIELDDLDAVDYAVEGHNVSKENQLVDELVENSPYPEVSSALIKGVIGGH